MEIIEQKASVIHIAIAFDKGYVTPVHVLLTSIFCNNLNAKIQIHAIATDVSEDERTDIINYVHKQGGEAHFYELDSSVTHGFPVPHEQDAYITLATYYRLFFPHLIPNNIERLLYIDVDTLVLGDLCTLYQTDIGENVLGAVAELEMPVRPEIGLTQTENYFNAGMLLIDVQRWRNQSITEQALKIIATQPDKLQYHDQDALNIVFKGSWQRLHSKYNLMKAYIPYDLPKKEYHIFIEDKIIIHYNGRNKPWHRTCENKFRFLYQEYLNKSSKSHVNTYINKPITSRALMHLIHSRILEMYFNHPKIGLLWRHIKRLNK